MEQAHVIVYHAAWKSEIFPGSRIPFEKVMQLLIGYRIVNSERRPSITDGPIISFYFISFLTEFINEILDLDQLQGSDCMNNWIRF